MSLYAFAVFVFARRLLTTLRSKVSVDMDCGLARE